MIDNKKTYMLETYDKGVNGSVTEERDGIKIVINGIDDGEYEIYDGTRFICGVDTKGKGRFIKRLDDESFSDGMIIKNGDKDIAWIKTEKSKDDIDIEKDRDVTKDLFEYSRVDESNYSFSSDFAEIIKKFKDQMERLEEEHIINKEDLSYIEGEKEEADEHEIIGWKTISPDDLWKLPIKDVKFPSCCFCIYGYLKYKHIYVCDMSDRFRVAVPDVFKGYNMPLASKMGFFCFSTLDGEMVGEGEEGYWMADVLKND